MMDLASMDKAQAALAMKRQIEMMSTSASGGAGVINYENPVPARSMQVKSSNVYGSSGVVLQLAERIKEVLYGLRDPQQSSKGSEPISIDDALECTEYTLNEAADVLRSILGKMTD